VPSRVWPRQPWRWGRLPARWRQRLVFPARRSQQRSVSPRMVCSLRPWPVVPALQPLFEATSPRNSSRMVTPTASRRAWRRGAARLALDRVEHAGLCALHGPRNRGASRPACARSRRFLPSNCRSLLRQNRPILFISSDTAIPCAPRCGFLGSQALS